MEKRHLAASHIAALRGLSALPHSYIHPLGRAVAPATAVNKFNYRIRTFVTRIHSSLKRQDAASPQYGAQRAERPTAEGVVGTAVEGVGTDLILRTHGVKPHSELDPLENLELLE